MACPTRYTPIFGHTLCKSEKQDKKVAGRIVRRTVSAAPNFLAEDFTHIDRRSLRHNSPWLFGKDGKGYFGNQWTVEKCAVLM